MNHTIFASSTVRSRGRTANCGSRAACLGTLQIGLPFRESLGYVCMHARTSYSHPSFAPWASAGHLACRRTRPCSGSEGRHMCSGKHYEFISNLSERSWIGLDDNQLSRNSNLAQRRTRSSGDMHNPSTKRKTCSTKMSSYLQAIGTQPLPHQFRRIHRRPPNHSAAGFAPSLRPLVAVAAPSFAAPLVLCDILEGI
jgi:hypothetical protein